MRISRRLRQWTGGTTGAAALILLASGAATAAVPIGQPMAGTMTYYNDVGYGACGTPIDASSQYLVAVSYQWWTSANPNNDPLCQGISVQVTYNGRTLTLPVRDKCPTCDAAHIDLSQPAFAALAPLDSGNVSGVTWQFVSSGTVPAPPDAPAGLRVTATTGSSISLAWSAVGGASSYTVRRDGAPLAATSATAYNDTGLAAGTSHTYTVTAANAAGAVSAPSAAVTAATTGGGGGGTGACPAPWSASTSYTPGAKVSYGGHAYTATYYSTAAVPNDPASWAVWTDNGPC